MQQPLEILYTSVTNICGAYIWADFYRHFETPNV